LCSRAKRFVHANRGNIATIFAVTIVPILVSPALPVTATCSGPPRARPPWLGLLSLRFVYSILVAGGAIRPRVNNP
jgi:hypothetical protein